MICITLAFMEQYGLDPLDLDGLAGFPLQVEGAEVGITLKERDPNVFKVSMRSARTVALLPSARNLAVAVTSRLPAASLKAQRNPSCNGCKQQ